MLYVLIVFFSLLHASTIHANWSSTSAKELKQPVNFSGKLITHQGQEFAVDNISVNGKYDGIPVIDKPVNHAEPELNTETKQMEITLDANPNADFTKTSLHLKEIKEISVPSPNTIWVYQKKKGNQKIEFIEIDVTTNSNTKSGYLLEAKTPIYCDAIDPAGPQEKTVPLAAVKTLSIEGFTYRETTNDKNKKCKAGGCPPCPEQRESDKDLSENSKS